MKEVFLRSRDALLEFPRSATGSSYTIVLRRTTIDTRFEQKAPLALELVDRAGTSRWLEGSYTKITGTGGGVTGEGAVTSPHKTRFQFTDVYTIDSDGFQMQRTVEIATPHRNDAGFSTRFGLCWAAPKTTRDCDILMPGAWYRDNQHVPPGAFGANRDFQSLMYREDRLGPPLAAARDSKSGVALVLERVGGNPTTFVWERGDKRIIDARFQVGGIGFLNAGHLCAAFAFPGTEDERPVLGPNTPPGPRYAPRSHPVRVGVPHSYSLHFGADKTPGFAAMVESVTRAALGRAKPRLVRADLKRVYRASLDLLNSVTQSYNGTVAVPFQVRVPGGEIKDTSTQMGFVGMGIPCAALLLADGFEHKDQSAIDRATAVVDFWVQESPNPSGVPKNWANFPAPGKVEWRGYPTHLRVASDGMKGVLRAWDAARRHHIDKPAWLKYARSFGDFLVTYQNADGSWFGSWNFDGTPHVRYTNASTHPLAFLVDLSKASGDRQYERAALRAGDFCWRTVHQTYSYVGGTPDNPNVTDKEAGVLALEGFMALWDAVGDAKWLIAARQAAYFCETWVYWRNIPIPTGNPKQVFPRGRAGMTTVGISIISTGHSGADNYMAIAPFLWYRLALATGDTHLLDVARLLLHNTKQVMNWDNKLGYRYAGLMPEAMGLAMDRGGGISGWLPWLTYVATIPMVQLRDTFGTWDIDKIERLPLAKRREMSAKFAATRGFLCKPMKEQAS